MEVIEMTTLNDFLRLNLQFFAEGDTTDPEPIDPPAPTDPVDPPPVDKTFTQAELDQIVKDRLARDRKKFADYDELKTKLTQFEEAENKRKESEMTELEKLQAQLQERETKEAALAEQLTKLQDSIKQNKIRNAFNEVATSQSIAYLDDAFSFADLTAVSIDEDGKVTGIEDVVEALVKNKPYLVAKKQQKPIGDPTNSPTNQSDKTAEQLLKEAADKARRTGKAEDRAAYAQLKSELNK